MSCLKDLGSYEIMKYQENLKTSQNYSLVLSVPSKMKTLAKFLKKHKLNFSCSVQLDDDDDDDDDDEQFLWYG